MRLVKKLTGIVLGTMIAAAACADAASVTGPERDAPTAPQFDGIGTAGSGNVTGIGTAGSGNATSSAPTTTTADGIGTAGSGNRSGTDSTTTSLTGIGTAGSGN
jgi:hypothetical protein